MSQQIGMEDGETIERTIDNGIEIVCHEEHGPAATVEAMDVALAYGPTPGDKGRRVEKIVSHDTHHATVWIDQYAIEHGINTSDILPTEYSVEEVFLTDAQKGRVAIDVSLTE